VTEVNKISTDKTRHMVPLQLTGLFI